MPHVKLTAKQEAFCQGIAGIVSPYDDMISTLSKMAEKVAGYEQRA